MKNEELKLITSDIIKDIEDDISDRSSIGDEWEQIDEDTKQSIRETWAVLISNRLDPLFKII